MLYSNYLYNLEPKTKAIVLGIICVVLLITILVGIFTRDKEEE